jgi:hypothetical protein
MGVMLGPQLCAAVVPDAIERARELLAARDLEFAVDALAHVGLRVTLLDGSMRCIR